MQMSQQQRVDALCQRHCAFALYALPGQTTPHFCMAEDGRTEDEFIFRKGFLLATFKGKQLFIPTELTTPPEPEAWSEYQFHAERSATSRDEYAAMFRLYSDFIRNGKVRKIVLARTADEPISTTFSPCRAFLQACTLQPNAFKALVHTPQYGTWLFCTPELLISGSDYDWHTMALAGTRFPTSHPWDTKNRQEQCLVADFMRDILRPLADSLVESPPENLQAGNIEHLCTRFHLRMPPGRILRLLDQLPPTPAVCGSPVASARDLLLTYPDIDRSCYAGYLGPWGDVSYGSAQIYVSLRCMQIMPDFCRLYAGGGLMPDSEEESEWQETAAKMQTMRTLLQTQN